MLDVLACVNLVGQLGSTSKASSSASQTCLEIGKDGGGYLILDIELSISNTQMYEISGYKLRMSNGLARMILLLILIGKIGRLLFETILICTNSG